MINIKDTKSIRLWAVDDDQDLLDVYELMFGDKYQYKGFISPVALMTELTKIEGSPHLIIVDLNMPGMDGIKLIQAARMVDNSIAFVIYSGFVTKERAKQALALGGVSVLEKPIDNEQLIETINIQLYSSFLSNANSDLLGIYNYFCDNSVNTFQRIGRCIDRIETISNDLNKQLQTEQTHYDQNKKDIIQHMRDCVDRSKRVMDKMCEEKERLKAIVASHQSDFQSNKR